MPDKSMFLKQKFNKKLVAINNVSPKIFIY